MWNILICKLYFQQLYSKYLCNLSRYWLQAPCGWHDSVEICRSVIIVLLLVPVQNKTNYLLQFVNIGTVFDQGKEKKEDVQEKRRWKVYEQPWKQDI
jgi:hypothetical protein